MYLQTELCWYKPRVLICTKHGNFVGLEGCLRRRTLNTFRASRGRFFPSR